METFCDPASPTRIAHQIKTRKHHRWGFKVAQDFVFHLYRIGEWDLYVLCRVRDLCTHILQTRRH